MNGIKKLVCGVGCAAALLGSAIAADVTVDFPKPTGGCSTNCAVDIFDVAVVGGGPAGIGAALASAKTGAKTVLVERDARLGGTTVSAEVLPIGLFHAWNHQVIAGPCWDLVTNSVELAGEKLPDFPKLDARDWWHHCVKVNPFVYSALAAETLEKAGVELRFNAAACGVERTSDGWKIALATDEGIRRLAAKEVVDATGSASVASFAGAERVRADDAQRQPGSYFFHLNTRGMKFDAAAVDKAHAAAVASGELKPTDIHIKMSDYIRAGGGWGCYVPLADNSTATARDETNRRGRETMLRVVRFIRRQPGLEKAAVVSASPEVGVRETYRVVGEKTVTEADYLAGTVEPDSLCYSYWYIDEHNVAWKNSHTVFHEPGKVGTIPLGAMIPKGVPHLLVAGRAVSSDHAANSALRVQASCMAIGQSAGVVAALAARRGVDPRAVVLDDAKRQLKAIGAIVPCGLETAKWQSAIDAASAAGGGAVVVPAGDHPTGMLLLKSNVELRLEKGARLVASGDPADYVLPAKSGEAMPRAVVSAVCATNVAVTGEGEIFGNGWAYDYSRGDQPKPMGLCFRKCRKVRLEDFTLRDAASWGINIFQCEDLVARRVKINCHAGVCTDGFDIEGKNIVIEDCDVDSGDDAYCVKSHDVGYVVENVVVRGCTARSHCNAFKIGTATHGVVRDISFVHCRAFASRRVYRDLAPMPDDLLNWKPVEGAPWYLCGPGLGCINVECVDGGLVENIVADDIEMEGFQTPIFVRGGDRHGFNDGHADVSQGRWFTLRNVVVSNVRGRADGRTPSTITGAGRCRPSNIVLKDINLEIPGEGANDKPYSWPGEDKAGAYPQTNMFDPYHLPSYGLFVDKANGVRMENVKFRLRPGTTDTRPAICEKCVFDADYLRPVRPIGVDGQPEWNVRSVFFMYPPTFGFERRDGAASYRFTVKDEAGVERSFTGRSPNDSLAPIWGELPLSGWMDLSCEALDARGGVITNVGARSFWKQAPFVPGSYPAAKRSPEETAKLIARYVMNQPIVQANYLSGKPVPKEMVNPNNQVFIAYPSKMGAAVVSAMAKLAVGETDEAKAARRLAEGAVRKLMAVTEPEGSPLAGFPRTYEAHPGLTHHPAKMIRENSGKIMLVYPRAVANAYLDLYEVTKDPELKAAAVRIADLYLKLQGEDGTWPLNVWLKDGQPVEKNRLVPVHMLGFLERMYAVTGDAKYRSAADRAFAYVEKGPLTTWNWEGQFEDVVPTAPYRNLTKHDACDTAMYLVRRFPSDPHRLAQAREIVRFAEDQFVCWERPMHGKKDPRCTMNVWCCESWRCPAVLEQYNCYVPIDASSAKLIRTWLAMYRATKNPLDLARARTLGDAIIRETHDDGYLPTFWMDSREDWPNCMLASSAALAELCSVSSVSSATSTTADLDALAREDYAHAIRPGGVDGSPFWNVHARMFMYPPAFDFSKGGPGTVKYRFTVFDAVGKTHVFDAPSSQSPLTPVWNDVAIGQAWVYVSAVDKDGKVHGIPDWPRDRFSRSFWRSAPFRPGSYPPAPRSYAEAVAKCGDEIFERPATQYFLKTGKPDPGYTHNCYPAKMHSALILGMLGYANRRPDRAEDALKLARNAADYLISISQPKGAPLEYWPPTYADRRAAGATRYGQNMLIYPCGVGTAYLALYERVKDAKYLDAAKRIADTYVRLQEADGTWPIFIRESDGKVLNENRVQPTGVIIFLERLYRACGEEKYRACGDRAFAWIEAHPLKDWFWEGQFEDAPLCAKYENPSKHPACELALYLLGRYPGDKKYLAVARDILRYAEDQFVCWEKPCAANGHGINTPTGVPSIQQNRYDDWFYPCVLEQYVYYVPVDASNAKLIRTYLALYRAEKNPLDLAKARALGDSLVRIQRPSGYIPTEYAQVVKRNDPMQGWLNCTCASLAALDELAEVDGE